MLFETKTTKGATFSPCRTYRYSLWRIWGEGKNLVAFIGLNPSTADESEDDPTIRRCIDFAKRWGHDGLYMLNLFAYRATDPSVMKAADYPTGPGNLAVMRQVFSQCERIVAAWGNHGTFQDQANLVLDIIPNSPYCLGKNKNQTPKHPLYVAAKTEPKLYYVS